MHMFGKIPAKSDLRWQRNCDSIVPAANENSYITSSVLRLRHSAAKFIADNASTARLFHSRDLWYPGGGSIYNLCP